MVTIEKFRELALSFDGTAEVPHFERRAFKVINKKIFATLLEQDLTANLVLAIEDQKVYCSFDKNAVYPVPNKFGLAGWTTFELKKVPVELIFDALYAAYKNVLHSKRKKR